MKILQVVHGFPPESIAGTETYCEALSRCLLARGHECIILAGSGRSAPQATLETVDKDGLLVTRYLRLEGRPRRWTEEYDPEAEGLVRHLLAAVRPDLVHLHHWLHLTNNLVAICADLGIPVVVTLHDVWTSCPRVHRVRGSGEFCPDPIATAPCLTCAERGPWQGDEEIARALTLRRDILNAELALADVVIVPSEAHRSLLLKLFELPKDRLMVLSHGSFQTIMTRERQKKPSSFSNRPLQVGHWGHFLYHKGTHLLLEALHQLNDPTVVQVHLIGTAIEQAYEERLHDLARGLSVQFHGAYQPSDLQAFDLDLAVFPSITSESYSFTIDEALRLGLPVLVSDRGALPERIGAAGQTFRAGDAGDLARRLQALLDAPETLEVMRRSSQPEMLFSTDAHVAVLEKIYQEATHGNCRTTESSTPYLKVIAHVQQQVRERERTLASLQSRLAQAEQQAAHAAAAETVAIALARERDAALREQRERVSELDAALREQRERVSELDAALREQRGRVSELEEGISGLDAEARLYREALEAILSSTTWKVTAPIRWIRHPVRALTGKDRFTINLAHLKSTFRRTRSYYRKTGLKATARRIIAEMRTLSTKSPDTTPYSPELFNISDIHPLSGDISSRVAVHAHVYYPDVITEL
ncbi:glycosyltransferase, partial [Candidatus Methylomirabilis sp.]|uniref:glycosyltransferase n=1 Tax=Candidatus Methylomirabilis sp. TaxID=2032687 RepID=UPI003076094E